MEKAIEIDINKKLEKDLKYIKNDLICKQNHKISIDIDRKIGLKKKVNAYCKFCKGLNAISVMNMTKKQYEKYWTTAYNNYPNELSIILKAIDEKFKNQLISAKKMKELIINSKDFPSEKRKALSLIRKEEKL